VHGERLSTNDDTALHKASAASVPNNVRARVAAGVVLITLVASALHLSGSESMLPHAPEPDAYIVYQSDLSASGEAERGRYPFLLVKWASWLGMGDLPAEVLDLSVADHLRLASAPFSRARIALAILALLLVPGTWLLARRFVGDHWALVATALAGSSLFLMCYTNQARPHGPVTALCLLAVLACMRMATLGTWASHLACGLTCGLAIASFPTGAFVLGPFAVASGLVIRAGGWKRIGRIFSALVIIAALTSWSYAPPSPTANAHVTDVSSDAGIAGSKRPGPIATGVRVPIAGRSIYRVLGHPLQLDRFDGTGFRVLLQALRAHDPMLLLASVLGAGVALLALFRPRASARHAQPAVALAFFLPLVVAFGMYGPSQERYFLPALPYLAVLGAIGVRGLVRAARVPLILKGAVLLAVLGLPLANATRLAILRNRPDTATLAASWIEQNVQRQRDRIFMGGPHLPILVTPMSISRTRGQWYRGWTRYLREIGTANRGFWKALTEKGYDVWYLPLAVKRAALRAPRPRETVAEEIDRLNPTWCVVTRGTKHSKMTGRAVLDSGGVLVQRVRPFPNSSGPREGLSHSLGSNAWTDIWRAATLGPVIDIYRLRNGDRR